MPTFPDTERVVLDRWTNFHATIDLSAPEHRLEQLRPIVRPGEDRRRLGAAISAIVKDSFDQRVPLRAMGSRWSLSNVVRPSGRILETSELCAVTVLDRTFARGSYAAHLAHGGGQAVYVEGGTIIRRLNDELGRCGLALRTSGAADGHRIAGLIATGTHGSNLEVGCLHDTVQALHLMVAPGEAILLMPERRTPSAAKDAPFVDPLADALGRRLGIPTKAVADDELFDCALVGIGSCGLVLGVVLDAAPLYVLDGDIDGFRVGDARVEAAIAGVAPQELGKQKDPYHFMMVVLPHADAGDECVFVTTLHRQPPAKAFETADAATSLVPADTSAFLARLVECVRDKGLAGLLRNVICDQAREAYGPRRIDRMFPGQVFGSVRLPPGHGKSTELAVDQRHAVEALAVVRHTLAEQASQQNRLLLGALGVRFVPASRATLAMNVKPTTCFIELPTLATDYTDALFEQVWRALDEAQIPYGFHWGQEHGLTPARVERYYGERAVQWKKARERLLDATGRQVFAAPILKDAGLD